MNSVNQLILGAASMVTPLGDTPLMVDTSIKAGISRYRYSEIYGSEENPVRTAVVPAKALCFAMDATGLVGDISPRGARMLRLAAIALKNIVAALPDEPIPFFIAGPEVYTGAPVISGDFIKNLALKADVNIDFLNTRFVNSGRAGAFDVIETAFTYLSSSGGNYALVGGVDSFYDTGIMKYLDDRYRLSRPNTFDGFVPGEGAGFLLLISPNAPEEIKQGLSVRVGRPGMSFEEGHLMSDEDYRGESLSKAFSESLNGQNKKISKIYSCENGETHYAKELSVALTRHRKMVQENSEVIRPAEFFGDLGAAFGAVAVGLASINLHNDENTLAYCSSDSGQRACVCVSLV